MLHHFRFSFALPSCHDGAWRPLTALGATEVPITPRHEPASIESRERTIPERQGQTLTRFAEVV